MLSHFILSGALIPACLMFAEDGGEGGGPADPAPDDAGGGAHEDPPELLPCPFCGTADPDDSGEQISCTHCSAMGPIAGSGNDKYGAWNQRDGDASAADPAPEDAPPTDPAAHAAGFKTLADARKEIVTLATKAGRVHAGFKQAVAAQKSAQAELATVRAVAADAIKAKAELAKEKKAHADYKAGESRRVNATAARILAASGHPAVEGEIKTNVKGDKLANIMARADFDKMDPAAKEAFFRAGGKISNAVA